MHRFCDLPHRRVQPAPLRLTLPLRRTRLPWLRNRHPKPERTHHEQCQLAHSRSGKPGRRIHRGLERTGRRPAPRYDRPTVGRTTASSTSRATGSAVMTQLVARVPDAYAEFVASGKYRVTRAASVAVLRSARHADHSAGIPRGRGAARGPLACFCCSTTTAASGRTTSSPSSRWPRECGPAEIKGARRATHHNRTTESTCSTETGARAGPSYSCTAC